MRKNIVFLKNLNRYKWEEISTLLEIPYRTLQDLIYGKITNPKLDTIIKLSKFFNVTIDDLINKDLSK